MKKGPNVAKANIELAQNTWGDVPKAAISSLRTLSEEFSLSVADGDLQLLDGRWYVTHSGLLRIAKRNRCSGMRTAIDRGLSDPAACRWVFKATVYKPSRSRGFV